VLNFCQAMSVGGKTAITFLDHPEGPIEAKIPGGSQWEPDEDFFKIVRKLCKIQEKMGVRLRIPKEGISEADIEAIEELVEIIDHGRTVKKRIGAIWTVSIDRPSRLSEGPQRRRLIHNL